MAQAIDREVIREALENLHDDVKLAGCKLAGLLPATSGQAAIEERAEVLRSLLLAALESVRPRRRGTAASSPAASRFGSAESRSYDVLSLRYLERLPVSRMEDELALGRRQIYRDLEEAENRLATVLSSWANGAFEGTQPEQADPLAQELDALASYPARVELQRLVAEAIALVEPLIAGRHTSLKVDRIGSSDLVLADRAILKQVLVQLLACGIQAGGPMVEVLVDVPVDTASARIVLRFSGDLAAVERRLGDAQRIAAARGIVCQLRNEPAGNCEATLWLQRGNPVSVLVIEDNPGAVELYRRYLSATGWQLHHTADPRAAREIAAETRPDVIVLDIMMPRLDGWSVLQSLRQSPTTAEIPVLICSVVEQPELAAALGAEAYLTKPVAQGEFLVALRSCLERRNRLRPGPPQAGE